MTNKDDSAPKCEHCGLQKLHSDVSDSLIILKRIDKRTSDHSDILNTVEDIAIKSATEISKNTVAIAENLKASADANLKLIEVAIGKKQVPLSIFLIGMVTVGIISFILFVSVFGIRLKFGSVLVDGEISPSNPKVRVEQQL